MKSFVTDWWFIWIYIVPNVKIVYEKMFLRFRDCWD